MWQHLLTVYFSILSGGTHSKSSLAFSRLSPSSSLFNWYTFLFSLIDALPMMSGFLEEDVPVIEARARACGLDPIEVRMRDGWAMVHVKKA